MVWDSKFETPTVAWRAEDMARVTRPEDEVEDKRTDEVQAKRDDEVETETKAEQKVGDYLKRRLYIF